MDVPKASPGRVGRFAARFAVAHFAGYPLAFLWAMAAIPLTIHLSIGELDALGSDELVGALVVHRLAWPAGAAFALAHAVGLPWALARDGARWQRRSLAGLAGLAAAGIAVGGASWIWLVVR